MAHELESALSGQQELIRCSDDSELESLVARVKASTPTPAPPLPSMAATEEEWVAVRVEGVCGEASREAGPVHVGHQFWRRLELDAILEQAGLSEGARRLSLAMTLNRLIQPTSELAMPEWIRTTARGDRLGVGFDELAEDALYRNLDKLHEHRVAIESARAERERNLFGFDTTVFLYDVTSTYFERRAMVNAKAKRGYSRDHRGDCQQVWVRLAVNREGFPLAHEVFAGNRHDPTTLEERLEALDRRVGLRPEQSVVVDRGMAGQENVKQIRARGLHYLVAEPYAERKDGVTEFPDSGESVAVEREASPRNPFQKTEAQQTFEYHREENKRAEAEKLDGSYLLKTDREDLSADEAWRIYKLLTRAEAAFRALKSPLAERPIFHHKQARVEAHIFLCVLAYHLLAAIEKTLLDAGLHTSWATVREQLKTGWPPPTARLFYDVVSWPRRMDPRSRC